MTRTALYPGSFDPVTNGHIDILRHALDLADRVIVAIGIHPGKAPLFAFEERVDMIAAVAEEAFGADDAARLEVISFDNLVIEAARQNGAAFLVRGLRDGTDLDFEMPDPENTLYLDLKDGRVVISLRPDLAPNHVARIKKLAREGFYDGIVFHRVIDGFMAQTGDPTGTGMGGSDRAGPQGRVFQAPFQRGVLGMARAANADSANSQFFIMFKDGDFLNGQYTVFGEVVDGMEHVDNITRGEPPANPDKIIKMQVAADATVTLLTPFFQDTKGEQAPMADIKDAENTLLMETSQGPVVIEMKPDLAPGHVARIKELVRDGFYDGIVFHRVIDGFMAQTGCPQGTGTGGSGKKLQGRVQQGKAHPRHLLDGPRHGPEFRRQPVLHLLHRRSLARRTVYRLG
jgi:peptidylprolyl isomerase